MAGLEAAVGESAEGENVGGRDHVRRHRDHRPAHDQRGAQEPLRRAAPAARSPLGALGAARTPLLQRRHGARRRGIKTPGGKVGDWVHMGEGGRGEAGDQSRSRTRSRRALGSPGLSFDVIVVSVILDCVDTQHKKPLVHNTKGRTPGSPGLTVPPILERFAGRRRRRRRRRRMARARRASLRLGGDQVASELEGRGWGVGRVVGGWGGRVKPQPAASRDAGRSSALSRNLRRPHLPRPVGNLRGE